MNLIFVFFPAFHGQCSVSEAWIHPSPWSFVQLGGRIKHERINLDRLRPKRNTRLGFHTPDTPPHKLLEHCVVGPGGLRAPCVLACAMRSLAIVFTIVKSFSLSLLFSLRLLLLTHFGEPPTCEIIFHPIFWHN